MSHRRSSARDERPDTFVGAMRGFSHPHGAGSLSAEADGNRTRQAAFAASTVLKTAGPTRHPDASVTQVTARMHDHLQLRENPLRHRLVTCWDS